MTSQPDKLEEWRERRLRVARFVQSKMLEVLKNGAPGAAASAARAFDRAAEVERQILESRNAPQEEDQSFRRWLE